MEARTVTQSDISPWETECWDFSVWSQKKVATLVKHGLGLASLFQQVSLSTMGRRQSSPVLPVSKIKQLFFQACVLHKRHTDKDLHNNCYLNGSGMYPFYSPTITAAWGEALFVLCHSQFQELWFNDLPISRTTGSHSITAKQLSTISATWILWKFFKIWPN